MLGGVARSMPRACRTSKRERATLPRMRHFDSQCWRSRDAAFHPARSHARLGHTGTVFATSLARRQSPAFTATNQGRFVMLYWAAVFFVIALVGAVLGFSGIAAGAAGIAKILFFVFLVLGALSLIFGRRVPT